MAKYELNIYGENDAIEKSYATNIVPWGIFVQAAEMQETIKDKPILEQLQAVGELLMKVFHGLTQDELYCADAKDVMNTFTQICSNGNNIKNGKNA